MRKAIRKENQCPLFSTRAEQQKMEGSKQMNEETLKTVVAFNQLPETDEIKEIKLRYLNDEIGSFEFFSLAKDCLEKSINE